MKKLSERELQVAERLFEGDTWDQTGAALGISRSTVRAHIDSIAKKLGAAGRKSKAAIKYYRYEVYEKVGAGH